MHRSGLPILATLAVTTAIGGVALAQNTPPGLRDLVGARAAGGETQMQARGYVAVRTETGRDRKYVYWWNADRRQCVSVSTFNGRYAAIVSTPDADCRRGGGDRPGRPDEPGRPDRPDYDRPGPGGGMGGGRPISLGLMCFGEGQKPAVATRYGWQWNSRTDRYDFGNRTELTTRQFDASVMIQIWDGGGRIRLPKSLIPPIHSGGSRNGWWDLYDVYRDRGTIRATYRLNGPNKPKVTIDRRSGRISIQGFGSYRFRGECDTIDAARHQRF